MGRPDLSVVLSTLGSYETLKRVLDGYSEQRAPHDSFEVLVVVDAGEPDRAAVERAIGTRSYPVRWIDGPRPGLSANRNAGWRAAAAPLVLFTDNNTIPVAQLVSEHVEWHRRHPDDGVAVLGLVRWARELDVTVFMKWLDTGIQFNFANLDGVEVEWGAFVGANTSLKRSFVERVGDFDAENLPYGYEDIDWAYRAHQNGMRLLYNRRAVVDHLRPMTLDFWKKRVRRVAASERAFAALHPEMPPWFHGVFSHAVRMPPARGRSVAVARFVPRGTPWLGLRVWSRVDMYYKQILAPYFFEAWNEDAAGERRGQPDVSEWTAETSGGAASGGPK